jgi:hypothetical protein
VTVDEELITQLGLLLTQTRFARRALEDIERATATYGTFAFTSVIAAGPKFGAPPMVDGALKVHVVNINDLAPGGGFGGFLEGLLGGAGRFVGNLVGGIIGGTISAAALIGAIPTLHSIAVRVERIMALLGIGTAATTPPADPGQPAGPGGSNLGAQLQSIVAAVNSLTGLFLAGSQPELAAQASNLPSTPDGERWRVLADSVSGMLAGIGRVVDGLIAAVPVALGAVALLISRLGGIRLAIAETLQFVLRNALLLRGVVAVLAFDTLAMIARTAAGVVRTLAQTLDGILSAAFDTVRDGLFAVLELGSVLGAAMKATVDALLNWLVPTIDTILRNFGDLRVFRLITHVVRILPAILPPLVMLKTGDPLGDIQLKRLDEAAKLPFLAPLTPAARTGAVAPAGASAPTMPLPAPNTDAILNDPDRVRGIAGPLNVIKTVFKDGLGTIGDTGERGLRTIAAQLDAAATREAKLSDATLAGHLANLRKQSTTLAETLIVGEIVEPTTGLEKIATAYESWLTGGGLDTLLGTITKHFSSAEGRAGIPRRIVENSPDLRATVQIDEVVIEVDGVGQPPPASTPDAAPPSNYGPGDFPLPPDRDDIERYARMWFDYNLRGGSGRLPAFG